MRDRFDLATPCIGVCSLDTKTGFCLGCWRSADEIAAWPDLDYDGKVEIVERLRARRRAAGKDRRRVNRRRRPRPKA